MDDNKRILLVDDQENIRSDLKIWLEKESFSVYTAASFKEAERIIESVQINYAIVDLKLDYKSDFGGIDVFNLIKQYNPMAKIIILSAYSLRDNDKIKLKGNYSFVSKGERQNYIRSILSKLKRIRDK